MHVQVGELTNIMSELPSTNSHMGEEKRPTWDEYFVNLLEVVRTRGTCCRARHGAIVVKDHQILSTGYNGSPSVLDHCTEVGCLVVDNHCRRTNHAEANAYLQAAKLGVSLEGATLYVTGKPCIDCMKDTMSVGIKLIKIADIEENVNFTSSEGDLLDEILWSIGVEYVGSDEHDGVCECYHLPTCVCR
jgi:dCMP deaminase